MSEEPRSDRREEETPTTPGSSPLAYRAPRDDRIAQPGTPLGAQGVIGFVVYFGVLVVALGNIAIFGGLGIILGLAAGVTLLVVTSATARAHGWRGFIPGVLIGLAVSVLLVGACFALAWK